MTDKSVEAGRRHNAAALLEKPKPDEPGLDALLVSSLTNVRYLTGFTGSNATLLLFRDGNAKLFTDPRYTVQSKQQATCRIRIAKGPLTKSVLQEIARTGVKRVGFEPDRLTVTEFEALKKDLPSRVELVPVAGLIEKLRMVKDEGEIALIRKSVNLNSRALERGLKRLKVGMSEADLAAEIDYQSRRAGRGSGRRSTRSSRPGPRAALPHAHPGSTAIGAGHAADRYGRVLRQGYASDMTRMVYLGKADAKYRKAYKRCAGGAVGGDRRRAAWRDHDTRWIKAARDDC
jgi:Xaa-Pro aminopeptidase